MKRYLKTVLAICLTVAAAFPGRSQSAPAVNMNQYLFPEFTECTIKSKTGTESTEKGNFNTITGKMAFIKDNAIVGLSTARQADTLIISGRRFVPYGEVFHEVVVNAPVTLFIHHESRLIPPGQPVGYGGTSKVSKVNTYSHMNSQGGIYSLEIPPDFEVKYMPVYWIRRNGEMHNFLGRTQFINIFPEHKKEIANFIKSQNIKMEDRDDLARLVRYCNELYAK